MGLVRRHKTGPDSSPARGWYSASGRGNLPRLLRAGAPPPGGATQWVKLLLSQVEPHIYESREHSGKLNT